MCEPLDLAAFDSELRQRAVIERLQHIDKPMHVTIIRSQYLRLFHT